MADGILEKGSSAFYLPTFDLADTDRPYLDSDEWRHIFHIFYQQVEDYLKTCKVALSEEKPPRPWPHKSSEPPLLGRDKAIDTEFSELSFLEKTQLSDINVPQNPPAPQQRRSDTKIAQTQPKKNHVAEPYSALQLHKAETRTGPTQGSKIVPSEARNSREPEIAFYQEPGFELLSCSIWRLRKILVDNRVDYPSSATQDQLVDLIKSDVLPRPRKNPWVNNRMARQETSSQPEGKTVVQNEPDSSAQSPSVDVPSDSALRAPKPVRIASDSDEDYSLANGTPEDRVGNSVSDDERARSALDRLLSGAEESYIRTSRNLSSSKKKPKKVSLNDWMRGTSKPKTRANTASHPMAIRPGALKPTTSMPPKLDNSTPNREEFNEVHCCKCGKSIGQNTIWMIAVGMSPYRCGHCDHKQCFDCSVVREQSTIDPLVKRLPTATSGTLEPFLDAGMMKSNTSTVCPSCKYVQSSYFRVCPKCRVDRRLDRLEDYTQTTREQSAEPPQPKESRDAQDVSKPESRAELASKMSSIKSPARLPSKMARSLPSGPRRPIYGIDLHCCQCKHRSHRLFADTTPVMDEAFYCMECTHGECDYCEREWVFDLTKSELREKPGRC